MRNCVFLLLALLLFSCSSATENPVCEAGRQVDCTCTDGRTGAQDCLPDGSGWGDCVCSCVKDCSGRECGDDPLCGESCGTCEANSTCNASGVCECDFLDCEGNCCSAGQVCSDAGKCMAGLKAYIQHFGGDDLVSGIMVEALDNNTGESLGITATSDATGWVKFDWGDTLVGEKVGFLCKGVPGDWHDTYQFNIDSGDQNAGLWAVDETTYAGAPLMAGLTIESGKAIIAGGLYFVEADGTENHIGCATVKTNPEDGEVRYFGDNGLPAPLTNRDTTNPLVAYFLIANMDPGSKVVEAYVDTEKIGQTSTHVYADAITITNIYSDKATDPEPANCQ